MVDLRSIKKLGEWPKIRKDILGAVTGVLGSLPKERAETQAKSVTESPNPLYTRTRVNYFVSEWERVAAYLFLPEADNDEELPAIVCCHDMVAQGKDEPAGQEGERLLAFAQHYAENGYVTIAPDCVTAGDRIGQGLDAFDTKAVYKNYPKMSVLGKMLSDHMAAIDVLDEMKNVDSSRIGVIGHGLGGVNALLLGALDERVQVCVASGGLRRFADDDNAARWTDWQGAALLPKLASAVGGAEYPFDWEHILALAAPNPTLILTRDDEDGWADTASAEDAADRARAIYRLLGEPRAMHTMPMDSSVRMDLDSLDAADDWFARWL